MKQRKFKIRLKTKGDNTKIWSLMSRKESTMKLELLNLVCNRLSKKNKSSSLAEGNLLMRSMGNWWASRTLWTYWRFKIKGCSNKIMFSDNNVKSWEKIWDKHSAILRTKVKRLITWETKLLIWKTRRKIYKWRL